MIPPAPGAEQGLRSPLFWVPCALATSVYAIAGWRRRWVSEDAFINLRVIGNLLDGHGPVYNVGERVEAYTSPLWLGLQAMAAFLAPWASREWLAALGGLLLASLGFFLAAAASYRLSGRAGLPLPFGLLIVLALPPFWDFATSGLETGLLFAWLGACVAFLARIASRPRVGADAASRRAVLSCALLIGLGPLVRPDLALFTLVFLAALLLASGAHTPAGALRVGLVAASVPLAYQVFRMGYFASLLPNTALAKEAFGAQWRQGLLYAADLAGPYRLWLPLLLVGLAWMLRLRPSRWRAGEARTVVLTAVWAAAALHALYVLRLGGDFMHGRFLLPALFAVLVPFAVLVVDARSAVAVFATLATLIWAVGAAGFWRVPYQGEVGPRGIADERSFWVVESGHPHPVTLEDYERSWLVWIGRASRGYLDGEGMMVLPAALRARELLAFPLRPEVTARTVLVWGNAGLAAYAAGPEVHVADATGLADPLGSRFRAEEPGRVGHAKLAPTAWFAARYTDSIDPRLADPDSLRAARRASSCGQLPELKEAVTGRLTPGRFGRNLLLAPRFTWLRVPLDPARAVAELCEPA